MKRLLGALLFFLTLPLGAQTYVSFGASLESSEKVTLRDRNCGSATPPALFGCGVGSDGQAFGARGEIERGSALHFAVGRERDRARVELLFTTRSERSLDAKANFTGVAGEQPVTASVRSRSLMLNGAVDVAAPSWKVRPFITGGMGAARNEVGDITFAFPSIAPSAVTVTRGGETTSLAWSGGVGVTVPFPHGFALDFTAKVSDVGTIRGDAGEALIVRPTRTLRLDIAATEMRWRTRGLSLTLRRRF